ncbi:portal vertex of the head [Synechococcus phage S-CAM4]|uniref:Portal protein n=5 Tax=Viruses TaxID=10239 RepID=A0A1D8KLW1_9CAUD|nr:portal protein [Synechococcus phage S-CAM4]AOV59587.1 portal vertex of the head [Synechococcus phage S-CAM4]AOV59825.1 portal vertex of the head [Synechococcus phage S-CAM4]
MSQLFGFQINRKEGQRGQSPVPPSAEDPVAVAAGGYYGTYVDTDNQARNEFEMIRRYRDMAIHPEVDSAVDEVVNEFIVSDAYDSPVEINLDNLGVGAGVKTKIRNEFEYLKRLLNFDNRAHEIVRTWYIDGRLFYHKVIDLDNPKKGITELRYIDPMKIKKVRQKIDNTPKDSLAKAAIKGTALEYEYGTFVDYYLYNPKGFYKGGVLGPIGDMSLSQGVKMATDSITFCPSGLQDLNKRMTLGFLHKAIKTLNQLRMIEDSIVIYRLSRAPERRIFYIDVGNLPKVKAEQYLRDVMSRYRNKLVYDAQTGEMRDDKKHMSMLEDFWLPRREGGRGTEITTLPGGQNLGELKDVEYFKKKLYNSLNLPPSRLTDDSKGFNLGKTTEVLRDELKFTKFIGRLRKRFSEMFHDMLKTQLILKGVISPEDWDDMKEHIQYDYLFDNHFNELKEIEMMNQRMMTVSQMDPFVGKYFSVEYIRRHVLNQKDTEYKDIDKQMKAEISSGLSIDPAETNAMNQMTAANTALAPEIQDQQAQDAAERQELAADAASEREVSKAKKMPSPSTNNK